MQTPKSSESTVNSLRFASEIRQGTPEYSYWKDSHICSVNHTATSGVMEAAGATEIFQGSVN